MSRQISIWHHSRLSGGDPPIDFEHAVCILAEQIIALQRSGLSAAASEIYFGVNGGADDAAAVQALAPERAQVIQHPDGARGEHPTLRMMQLWAKDHPGWYVLYHHVKGATHKGDEVWRAWRRCMQRVVIHDWQACVRALEAGFDAAGPHWITAENCSVAPVPNYFGGNFFWVTSNFLNTLPLIAPTAVERLHFYDAEVLIARGSRPAKAMQFARHFPGAECLKYLGHDQH